MVKTEGRDGVLPPCFHGNSLAAAQRASIKTHHSHAAFKKTLTTKIMNLYIWNFNRFEAL